jgi:hypothetical protein
MPREVNTLLIDEMPFSVQYGSETNSSDLTDSMVEAVARALCRHAGHDEQPIESVPMWRVYIPAAIVAVKAAIPHLRRPSEN